MCRAAPDFLHIVLNPVLMWRCGWHVQYVWAAFMVVIVSARYKPTHPPCGAVEMLFRILRSRLHV